MKQRILSLLSVLCLLAIPLAAQEGQTQEELERRTDPSARVLGPDPGLTLTGEVLELGDEHMRVQTLVGPQIVRFGEAQVPAGLQVGDRVTVDYSRTSGGVMIARQIRPFEVGTIHHVTGTVVEITDQELVLRTDVGLERYSIAGIQLPAGLEVGDRVTVELTRTPADVVVVERVTVVGSEVAVTQDPILDPEPTLEPEVLPATASSLPWVAVLGLFALFGAAVLRFARV